MKHPSHRAFLEIRLVGEFPARCWAFPVFCPDYRPDSYPGYETVSDSQAAVKEAEG